MNAIFYFHILLLLLLPYNGPDHTHTPTHTLTHTLRGTFDSYKWPVLVLWVCCGRHGGGRGGDCNQSADINIFRVANHKLLRLAGGTAATALCPLPFLLLLLLTEAEAAQARWSLRYQTTLDAD